MTSARLGLQLTLMACSALGAEPVLAQAVPLAIEGASQDMLRRADAQLRLAELFENGEGVEIDLARARLHYEQAASAGSETAKLRLGQMLVAGLGGPRDAVQGLELIREVAGTGSTSALVSLGALLSGGALGYVDANGAVAAYEQASGGGNVEAMVRLGDLFQAGEIVAVDLQRSFDYYKAAAAKDNATAALAAAEMLAGGRGVAQDVATGMATLRAAAAAGDGDAALALGDLLLGGDIGQIDVSGAIQAYETAAERGRNDGYLRLGALFRDGYYVRRDAERAVGYYQKAADAGEPFGLYALGAGYLDRDFGTLGTMAQGMALLQQASASGNQYAVTAIAQAYFYGQGVDADIAHGLAVLAEAAAGGNPVAALDLVAVYRDGLKRSGRILLGRSRQAARQHLQSIEGQLDRGARLYQTLLLDASSEPLADPEKIVSQLAELSIRDRRSLVSRLLPVNPNVFVAVVQVRLRSLGYLAGQADGWLDRRTIRAINTYCRSKATQDICRHGPLSAATAVVLSSAF